MKLLLDTHIFLWYIGADSRLPAPFKTAIRDSSNVVYLSVVSIWEAVIKFDLGKLPLPENPSTYLPSQRIAHGFASLSVDEPASTHLAGLPAIHRDPFDRMLVAQSLQHGFTLVTVDPNVLAYPVSCLPRV